MHQRIIYFSIIIPYFSNTTFLNKCLKSIQSQNLNNYNYEIIIIDDFSRTNLIKVKNKFSKIFLNFSIINLNKNIGPGLARNIGIRKSKGKYLFFIDSDDEIKKNTLSKLLKIVRNNDIDIISFNYELRKISKIYKSMRNDQKILDVNKKLFVKLFLEMNYNNSVIFSIFKRSLIIKNNIKFNKGYHEDILFFFKCFFYCKEKIFINENLYIKNNKKNSIINTFSKKHVRDYMDSWIHIYNFLNKKYNTNYINKYLLKSFIRGLIGIIAILILKILKFNKNYKLKREYVNFLIFEYKKKYHKYINKTNINVRSRYDKIFEEFFVLINKNNNKNFKLFEKKITKLI